MKEIKIFDTHSDMLYDIARRTNSGVKNRFESYHVKQLNNSIITGAIWTMYSPDEFDLFHDLETALNNINIKELNNFSVILGLEGLRNMKNIEDIDKLYQMGFRHAMLTWNEENQYATGAKSNPEHGLTEKGKKVLKRMQELGMIIDLAHLNEKSFYEAIEYLKALNKPVKVMYSHGCVKKLCNHVRNLTDEQMFELKKINGIFGLTLANNFVNVDKDKQDLEHFLDHLDEAIRIMSVNNVCFGFDFMDYLDEFPNSNIEEVSDATKVSVIIEGMKKRGYSEEDISKVCYDNVYSRFNDLVYDRSIK